MEVVQRRILEQDDPGRNRNAACDDVHRGASPGAVRLPVRQLSRDVLVPAQRVELVLVVVIQWGLVPKPPPRRIRIIVDREVERVVVRLDRACPGHFVASAMTTSTTRLRYGQASPGGSSRQSRERLTTSPTPHPQCVDDASRYPKICSGHATARRGTVST